MIVVTGATGNVGSQVAQLLAAAGEEVGAVSRQPTGASAAGPVRRWQADLANPPTLAPALAGADALFLLVAGPDPAGVLAAAKAGGVRRVVLLSSQGAGTRPQAYQHPRAFEDAVRESGLEWTVLRPGGFDSNTLAWAETIRTRRLVAAPFGEVGLPFVDPADVAEAAVVALREFGHAGRTYQLTGPAPVSPRDRARAIADALGERVEFVEQTPAEARSQLLRFMPEPVVAGTLSILGSPLPAEQQVSPDLERLLGRPPRTFAEWAARNLAAFR